MLVFVKIEVRGGETQVVPMDTEKLRIGRREDANEIVLKRRSVSRSHAVLARREGRFVLADLKSAGGTFVNGERLTAPRVIRPGDRVSIGEYQLSLVIQSIDDASAFEEMTSTRKVVLPGTSADSRDAIRYGEAGDALTLFHGDGRADRARLERAVLGPAFEGIPPPDEVPRGESVSLSLVCAARPRVFPGGDLGALSVALATGALAERGAVPLGLQLDVIAEEGFAMQEFHRHLRSIRAGAWDERVGVRAGRVNIMTDGFSGLMFGVHATGNRQLEVGGALRPGDQLIASGSLGRHGAALAAQLSQARLDDDVFSDAGTVAPLVRELAKAEVRPRAICFPFQGGLAHALQDLARKDGARILVEEGAELVDRAVQAAALQLDLSPLFEPSAGRLVVVVDAPQATRVMDALGAAGGAPVRFGSVLAVGEDDGAVVAGREDDYQPLRRYEELSGDEL